MVGVLSAPACSSSVAEDYEYRSLKDGAANGPRAGPRPMTPFVAVPGLMMRVSNDLAGGTVKREADSGCSMTVSARLRVMEAHSRPRHRLADTTKRR